jgi:hypothetical protein
MGNQPTRSSSLGYPNKQLKAKNGDRTDPIPCPIVKSSYQSLYNDPKFKEYVLQNLHSSFFIRSILQNSEDEAIVMEGIPYFLANSRERRTEINNDVKKFQDFIISGLQASLPTTIQICEKDLEFHKSPRCSPYLCSLQCRLAVIRDLESSILLERKKTQENILNQRLTVESLNSSDHPQLSFIAPLMKSGISLIEMIPLILPATQTNDQRDLLVTPFKVLCQQYLLISDLYLFNCWSPTPRPPLKKLKIERRMISANFGDPFRVLKETNHQYWTCSSKGGGLSVQFDLPTIIVSVSISWAPPHTSSSLTSGAPQKLHILVRRGRNGSPLEHIRTVDVDEERKKSRSWNHEYHLGACTDVVAILLRPEGISQYNQSTTDPIKIYNMAIFSEDPDATWIDTMSLVQQFHEVLCSLKSFRIIEKEMYSTLFTLPRITGSLLLILDLLHFLQDNNPLADLKGDQVHYDGVWSCVHQLLSAIQKVHLQLQENLIDAISTQETSQNLTKIIVFDENAKSPDMTISDGGRVITCNSGGSSYGLVDCEMEKGIWEWEMSITKDNHGDETSCLGVARRPVSNCSYDTTPDMWLIRCYNGDTYHCGRLPKKRSIPQIHPNDICKFRFDSEARTLALCVNDLDVGVIFDNLDVGISPAVSFYGSGKSIKLLSIRQVQNSRCYDGIHSSDLSPVTPLPPIDQLQTPNYNIVTGILSHISELVTLHLLIFGASADDPKANNDSIPTLDYPFAIQVSQDVFKKILSLLQHFAQSDDTATMISLLNILKGQFACLAKSNIDPSTVGFGQTASQQARHDLVDLGHTILNELMKHSHPQLKIIAAETFSQGIQFFLSTTSQQLSFAVDLISEIYPLPLQLELSSSHFEVSQFIVLKTIIKQLSNCREILKMINSCYHSTEGSSHLVSKLINFCLHLTVDIHHLDPSSRIFFLSAPDFQASLYKLISSYQEQLLVDVLSNDSFSHGATISTSTELCASYLRNLFLNVDRLLDQYEPQLCSAMELFNPLLQDEISHSIIGKHFFPALHGLCLSLHHLELNKELTPYLMKTLEKVSNIALNSPSCQIAHNLLSKSFNKIQQKPVVVVDEVNGWRQIKAQFEDSQPDFAITEEGMVYTSVHSANTCAVIHCGFSGPCRAAWEFVLESDTLDDECAVFGAAHLPLSNRSHSASPNLYMRRAYNGHLYHRGRALPSTQGKIHPGDIVRIEYDGRAETLSYSVNGSDLETCFTNVVGEIFPCCGSYRNNVRIRLLKVEVFGAASLLDEDDDSRSPEVVKWVTDGPLHNQKDQSILSFSKELLPKQSETLDWLTGRGDRGASEGVHSWNFEILECSNQPLAFGVVFGETLMFDQPLAGLADSRPLTQHQMVTSSEGVVNQAQIQSLLSVDLDEMFDGENRESFELNCDEDPEPPSREYLTALELPPMDSDFPPIPTLSRTSTPAESPLPLQYTRRRSSIPTLSTIPTSSTHQRSNVSPAAEMFVDNQIPLSHHAVESIAWHSDGSLWVNGKKKYQSFGVEHLPLQKLAVVGIKVDRNIGTVTFFVNGVFVGVAFGPHSCSPAVTYNFPLSGNNNLDLLKKGHTSTCYPAASISSRTQSVRIVASGFHGSVVIPILLSLQRTLTSVVGRSLCTLIEGVPLDQSETQFSHWMKSPLFMGGLDDGRPLSCFESWETIWKRIQLSSPEHENLIPLQPSVDHTPESKSCHLSDSQHRMLCGLEDNDFLESISKAWMEDFLSPPQQKICLLFMEWLDSVQPEPPALKGTLLKSGTYSFPKCEYPVLASMLKHGILVHEARYIFSLLESETATMEELPLPSPSMTALTNKIKQLRWHLRKQRQFFLSCASETADESKNDNPSEDLPTDHHSRPSAIGKSIDWLNFSIPLTSCNSSTTHCCRVLSIGCHYPNKQITLNLNITSSTEEKSSEDSQNGLLLVQFSSLLLNGVELSYQSFDQIKSNKQEIVGQLLFSVPPPASADFNFSPSFLKTADVIFRYGTKEFTSVLLLLPELDSFSASSSSDSKIQNSDKSTDLGIFTSSFDQLCANISEKAQFLLKIVPSAIKEIEATHDLTLPPPPKLVSWRSDDSHEKWRSVAGVLKVQKKIRRQLSEIDTSQSDKTFLEEMIPDLETNSDNEADDNPTYSKKSVQECLLFILSETVAASSVANLTNIIERRHRRGVLRAFGLDALNTLLQIPSIALDPTSVTEALVFFKSSMLAESCLGLDEEQHQKIVPVAHYFSSLEGCNRTTLCSVQHSFHNLYLTLSDLLIQSLKAWKDSDGSHRRHFQDNHSLLKSVTLLLSCWSLHFPTSDSQFILDSPLLPALFELTSFSIYETAVSNWFSAAESFLHLLSKSGKSLPGYSNITRNWKPWSSSYVHKALRFGQLSCRTLLFHLHQVPSGLLSNEDKINLQIPIEKSFEELCLHYDVSSICLLHENILGLFRSREQKRQKQFEKAQAEYFESRALEEQAEKKRLRDAGVPLFDPSNQSSDIFMEDSDQVAGVKNFQSSSTKVASSYVELQYNLSIPQVDRTGNYFEVTILKSGMKDIGIGFGVLGLFPVTGEMPGWEPHSYGYHGDDGTKFGVGATPEKWPIWDDGDVIGCGIDFSRRAIFFTRNGVLLGDGFRNIPDDNLMPVVSFHSPNVLQKVRINFGLSDFLYKGTEVVVNAAALRIQEQHRTKASSCQSEELNALLSRKDYDVFRLSESDLKKALSSLGCPTHGTRPELEIRLLGALENDQRVPTATNGDGEDSKEDLPEEDLDLTHWCAKEYISCSNRLTAATIHLEGLNNLRNYAGSLLRHLLTTSCSPPVQLSQACGENEFNDAKSLLATSITEMYLTEIHLGAQYLLEAFSRNPEQNEYLVVASPPPGHNPPLVGGLLGLLEVHEVEYFLGKIVFSLYSLIHHSAVIKDLILSGNNLQSFFLLTQIGSPRLRRMVLNILFICLPSLTPPSVERSLLVSKSLDLPLPKSRGLPDTFLRMLMKIICDAISVPSKPFQRSDFGESFEVSHIPLGYGRLLLNLGDHCIAVVRHLLGTPNWTEVIACYLTDCFKSAGVVVRQMMENAQSDAISQENLLIVSLATAACTIFSGLGVIRPGAQVVKNTETTNHFFWVVSVQESSQSATICASNIFHETQVVPLTSLRPVTPSLSIDISTLSQPLLQEFLSLMETLLLWFQQNSPRLDFSTQSSLARLMARLSSSFALLYEKSPAIFIDHLTPDLIDSLVQVSLDPISLKFSPTLGDISFMWTFIQSRILEISHGSKFTTNQLSSSGADSSVSAPENIQPQSLDFPPSVMIFSERSINERRGIAEEIGTELDLPLDVCLKRLDYYSGDKDSTRQSLLRDPSFDSFQPLPLPSTTTISDENAMRYIDHPSDLGRPTSDTSGHNLRVPDVCSLVRLVGSSETCKISSGSLIIRSPEDGAFGTLPSSLYVCVNETDTNEMISQYCDDELGISFYCNLPRSESSFVTSLYDHQIEEFPTVSHSIDVAISKMQFRHLALSLVVERKVNLLEESLQEKIFLLLKFQLRNENSNLLSQRSLDFLSELCTSSSAIGSSVSHFHPQEYLVDELTWNFSQLLESSTNGFISSSSKEVSTFYACESTHPIEFGFENCGVFEIPESWKGSLVLMDSRCSTDDAANNLSFYGSQEDFQNVKPLKKFWGKSGTEKSNFQSFLVPATGHSILSYRFTTGPLENRIITKVSSLDGKQICLGNCAMVDGSWAFEVKISSRQGDVKVGVIDEDDQKVSIFLNQDSEIYCGAMNSQSSLGHLQDGDVISCAILCNSEKFVVQFGRNGVWSEPVTLPGSMSDRFYPFYQADQLSAVEPNFGDAPLTISPSPEIPDWKPLVLCLSSSLLRRSSNNWGYSFQVRPIGTLSCIVARDFELILKAQLEEGNDGESLYFWRAKRISGFKSCGDIITKDSRPPRGCVLVASDHCKPIKRYSKVFSSSKHNLTVWKPLPVDGYGCLGDIVTIGTSKPNASACCCVPLDVLTKCGVVHCWMKSKSKTSKGHQIASIWEVSNHMGHFFGSPTERRDFMRKTTDGVTCPAIPYAFKTNFIPVVLGEWTHEEDVISHQPSLQWSLFLCQFFLSNERLQKSFVKAEMFQLLMKYLCSTNSPENVSVLPILIQMIRISLKYKIQIGIETIAQTCKKILNTIYVKYKSEKSHFLNHNVFELMNFVSEAIHDSNLFKSSLTPEICSNPSNSSDLEVMVLPTLEKRNLSSVDLSSFQWSNLIVPDHVRERYRLFSLTGADAILSSKPQMLRQLRDIRFTLSALESMSNPLMTEPAPQYFPPELLFTSWTKHMRAVAFDESSHPYNANDKQSYRKEFHFPGAKTISVCFDPRCMIHENSTLRISNGQSFLAILDSSSLKESLLGATIVSGSQLIIEFDVNPEEESKGLDYCWGWGIVAAADGPVYEKISRSIDLDEQVKVSCVAGNEEEPLKICNRNPVGSAGSSYPLTESELLLVKQKGYPLERGVLEIPFCHQLKLSVLYQRRSAEDSISREYVLEIMRPGKSSLP